MSVNPETLRRAYLSAMQVETWVPRVALPFAAVSRPDVLAWEPEQALPEAAAEVRITPEPPARAAVPAPSQPKPQAPVGNLVERLKAQLDGAPSEPAALEPKSAEPVADAPSAETAEASKQSTPHFALQLLRAGACLLLVETPTGYPMQSRDPAYLLLKDMLRAAGLPDRPMLLGDGEPIRWPLLRRGNLDQGPQAARDYVQGVLMGEYQRQACACIWLVGLPALRFAADLTDEHYNQEQTLPELGSVWAIPSLELLMDEPQRKAPLWQAMRQLMPRWKSVNE